MFTENQQRLINEALRLPFPYFLFAQSVKKQGRCTVYQECALCNMINKYEMRKRARQDKVRWGRRKRRSGFADYGAEGPISFPGMQYAEGMPGD